MKRTVQLTVPLPPSANDLVRPAVMGFKNGRPIARLVKTKEAEEYRDLVHAQLRTATLQAFDGALPLELHVTHYLPSLSSDASNRIKALEDALQGFVFANDRQFAEIRTYKRFVGEHGVTEPISIIAITPADEAVYPELARRLRESAKNACARAAKAAIAPEKETTGQRLKRLATSATVTR